MGRRRPRAPGPAAPGPLGELHSAIVVDHLDLHGLTVEAARRRTVDFLATAQRKHAGRVVRIVTGAGRHSAGTPRLRTLLERMLGDPAARPLIDAWQRDVDGGSYLIRLR